MNCQLKLVILVFLTWSGVSTAWAGSEDWPRSLPLDEGTVSIYPLQVDERIGDVIRFRAALAYRKDVDAEPVFGAGWFESRVEIDNAQNRVRPVDLKVIDTRFPAGTADIQDNLANSMAQQSSEWNLDFTVDELNAALEQSEIEKQSVQQLNTSPPKILYRDGPALLVSLDGDPVLREIEDSDYQAVINTPYPLIYDGRHYYLNAARNAWYRADSATGPYRFDATPPAAVAALVQPDEELSDEELAAEPVTAQNAPEIVVSTEPAELIVTDGPAAFVPLVDDLLVLQNSDDDVFLHVQSQQYYVVLAGRWYYSGSLNGPWTYQAADALPIAFAEIPEDSDQADSRVFVAGTDEAREAVLDAAVPQTAAVERGQVDIDVDYDGDPNFDSVDGTDMTYAQNTGSTVIESNGLYYLVEDGVWYVSVLPDGPWQVADYRPQQVASIMPTSPVYNVKYVHVYDSTPQVVYVGYTPGYLGSYVHYNTIFYGSGWHYRPWVSPYTYYPRFSTWGWSVSYNSWSGWNFGFGWGWGPFSAGYYSGGYWHRPHYWHHRHYSRWGPRGYRPRHYARNDRGYGRRHGGHGRGDYGNGRYDRGHDGGGRDRGGRGTGPGQRHDNLYRDSGQRALIADTRDVRRRSPGAGRSADGPNRTAYTQPTSNRGKGSKNRERPVGYADTRVPNGLREQSARNKSPSATSRLEPVTVAQLGDKARSRDRDASGKRNTDRNRIEPVRVADLNQKARQRDAVTPAKGRSDRNRTEPVRASKPQDRTVSSNMRAPNNGRSRTGRTEPVRATRVDRTQPVARAEPTNKSRATKNRTEPVRSTQPGRSNRTSVRSSDNTAGRSQVVGQSRRSPNSSAPVPVAPVRVRSNSGPRRSASVNPAPGPRQSGNRPGATRPSSPPQSSRSAAPVQSTAPARSSGMRGQGSRSNSGGGRRQSKGGSRQ